MTTPGPDSRNAREALEIRLLLEGIFRHYGFDFRSYAQASIRRRIWKRVAAEQLGSVSGLQEQILHDADCMERLLLDLTVHVTAMFRDPVFHLALRQKVVPMLRTYPFIRIWHAGCSTGEEVYSLAILLQEEGLYDKSRIYATDMSEAVLKQARDGIFPLASMKDYTKNYLQAGGAKSFSNYYTAKHDHAIFSSTLKENVVFSRHNLATDSSFNEFNLVLCRNVMIYFNKELQARVHALIYDSLCHLGVLALGSKESLKFSAREQSYETLDAGVKLYRRVH